MTDEDAQTKKRSSSSSKEEKGQEEQGNQTYLCEE
jgi:hypothetical protein